MIRYLVGKGQYMQHFLDESKKNTKVIVTLHLTMMSLHFNKIVFFINFLILN